MFDLLHYDMVKPARIFGFRRYFRLLNRLRKDKALFPDNIVCNVRYAKAALGMPDDWTYSDDGLKPFVRNPEIDTLVAFLAMYTLYLSHYHPEALQET